jgi:nucleotide-binding universal stress UspA family protein/CBS domain-containing protein
VRARTNDASRMSFQRVIVAFDGSERAQDALALGVRLCEPDGVLTLACVVPGQHGLHLHRADAQLHGGHDSMFADARATVPAGIHVREQTLVAASAARGLTDLAENERADLVVVGSSSHADDGRIRLERTAGRFLQGAPCAVAIAPAGLHERDDFHHVGIAFDDSPEAHAALAVGVDLAARFGAEVTTVYAVDELDRAACDGVVDLLVTGTRGNGPIHRALLGSVSEQLTEGAPYPVLVVPCPREKGVTMTRPLPHASESPFATFTVLNALQLSLIECRADADVPTVARAMADNRVHCVVVRGTEPDGWSIVSDLDLMSAVRPELAGATAGQLAASDALIVDPADTLEHAAQLMAEHETSHAVVVDPVTRRPIGILSTLDVARFLAA